MHPCRRWVKRIKILPIGSHFDIIENNQISKYKTNIMACYNETLKVKRKEKNISEYVSSVQYLLLVVVLNSFRLSNYNNNLFTFSTNYCQFDRKLINEP